MKKITALAALAALAIAGCGSTAAKPPAAAAAKQRVLTCSQLNPDGAVAKVVADMRSQDHLVAEMSSTLSAYSKDHIVWGAWVPPGLYAQDLSNALADEENWAVANTHSNGHPTGSVDISWPSNPPPLSGDAGRFNDEGSVINSNLVFDPNDWTQFTQDVAALQSDCGW
ncbi:MAG TPA: hypothetical protein VMV92_44395 [Streptosporangiaceae bacterium]|nr:hypothetical protein [Streptosporangiaceae bacterium]HVB44862.1 hypothetical protein [Streptosporangiaceae bacterium]